MRLCLVLCLCLFSSFSAPAVVEARLFRKDELKPSWTETYYALSGRTWIKDLPKEVRTNRAIQLRASLQRVILKILEDLEAIPDFPKRTREHLAVPSSGRTLQDRILAAGDGLEGTGGRQATPAAPALPQ